MAVTGRQLVLTILLCAIALPARAAFADWWLTPDQQGRIAFEQGDYPRAAQLFNDRLWKGLAFYAAGDFANAAAWFAQLDTPYGYFYLGNALAHQARLPAALDAYRAALALDPDLTEAVTNFAWVGGLAALDEEVYEDAGGTGGKLGADDYVFSDRAKDAQQTMDLDEASTQGLSDEQIEEIWMRRVQTTPAEFLSLKFAYQLQEAQGSQ